MGCPPSLIHRDLAFVREAAGPGVQQFSGLIQNRRGSYYRSDVGQQGTLSEKKLNPMSRSGTGETLERSGRPVSRSMFVAKRWENVNETEVEAGGAG